MEIEKRYEIKGTPPLNEAKSKIYIEQVYSVIGNESGSIPDVRIRKTENDKNFEYFHTVKYKTGDKNSRIELEQNISEEEYNKIFKLINKKPVRKNRYLIPIDNELIAEVDEFLDINKIIVEVEFPDEESMKNFVKPNWFGSELKGKQSFSTQIFSKINNDISINFY